MFLFFHLFPESNELSQFIGSQFIGVTVALQQVKLTAFRAGILYEPDVQPGNTKDGPRAWVPDLDVWGLDGVPGSWLVPSPTLWGMNQQMEAFSPFSFLFQMDKCLNKEKGHAFYFFLQLHPPGTLNTTKPDWVSKDKFKIEGAMETRPLTLLFKGTIF